MKEVKIKPLTIKLDPPCELGLECLKLFFSIDNLCQLNVKIIDLRSKQKIKEEVLDLKENTNELSISVTKQGITI